MTRRHFSNTRVMAYAFIVSVVTAGTGAVANAAPATVANVAQAQYRFQSIASPQDLTFTQLLGINDQGTIAGYFGSGATGHPNKGFTLTLPRNFTSENYPNSAQTQVIAIDNAGDTGGFWIDDKGTNHGFVNVNGAFTPVDDPLGTFNQILGVRNGVAVGTYQDARMMFHAYIYNYNVNKNPLLPGGFSELGQPNAQATGVAAGNMISGFSTDTSGATHGFLLTYKPNRRVGVGVTQETTLMFPTQGVTVTQALGVNDAGQVVGQYTDAGGATHGFIYQNGAYQSIDYTGPTQDGKPATATTVNGINNNGQIVGFYVAANGNTVGFTGAPGMAATQAQYTFQSIASPKDPTFTQLLGINDNQFIAGYFGSGATGHPNKGFVLTPAARRMPSAFLDENYPNSAQTQVVAIDNAGDTGGFWIDDKGTNHGFVNVNGRFASVDDPRGTFNQILGVRNGRAVGTYQDAQMMFHAYIYNFEPANLTVPGVFTELPLANAQATGTAAGRKVSGFSTDTSGATHGFLLTYATLQRGGISVSTTPLNFPTQGVTVTQALGVNDAGQVVGQYTDAGGATHGFIYQNGAYQSIDYTGPTQDGKPATATTVNGINNNGQIVGFYVAANGNTVGFTGISNAADAVRARLAPGETQALSVVAAPGALAQIAIVTRAGYPGTAVLYTADSQGRFQGHPVTGKHAPAPGSRSRQSTAYLYRFTARPFHGNGCALLTFTVPHNAPQGVVTMPVDLHAPNGRVTRLEGRRAAHFVVTRGVRGAHPTSPTQLAVVARRACLGQL